MKKIITISLLLLAISSCASSAPAIVYENISQKGQVIRNIKVKWNKYYIMGKTEAKFCGGLTQINNIANDNNFFGPIQVEWENAKGKKLTKNLVLKKEDLPSMKKRHEPWANVFVTLYFTQDDVYLYTSDTPNLKQIEADLYKKAGLTCQEYRDREYKKKWGSRDNPVLQPGYKPFD